MAVAIGEPLTLHKYIYTNANPVNAIDPSGLETTVYIHSGAHWYGHAAIDVNGTVYTFGRYISTNSYSAGTKGDGYLFQVPRTDYFANRGFTSSRDTVDRYSINLTADEESRVLAFLEGVYNSGTPSSERYPRSGATGYYGRVLSGWNNYRFIFGANNCSTLIQDALSAAHITERLGGMPLEYDRFGLPTGGIRNEMSPIQFGRILEFNSNMGIGSVTKLTSHEPSETKGRERAIGNVFDIPLVAMDYFLDGASYIPFGYRW